MTIPIPAGTRQITFNVPIEEHQKIIKFAGAIRRSMGSLMRDVTLKGFEAELIAVEGQLHRELGFISQDGQTLLLRRAEALRQTVSGIRRARERYYGTQNLTR